jgi:hypothetical protein
LPVPAWFGKPGSDRWILEMKKKLGKDNITSENIEKYIRQTWRKEK